MIKAEQVGMSYGGSLSGQNNADQSDSQDGTAINQQVTVLEDISFSVPANQTVAIVGPSGSGKTTLLLLLAALERPTHGVISIAGHDLASLDDDRLADLRREQLGIVFQSFHLIASLDALSNIALPLEISGHKRAREVAKEMLEKVGLAHRASHYPRQMSGGEQQRVAIARALAHQPKLILADEPTGNLDTKTGKIIADMLFGLHAESGATLVLVTHDPKLAARCDRTLQIENGRLSEDSVAGDYQSGQDPQELSA